MEAEPLITAYRAVRPEDHRRLVEFVAGRKEQFLVFPGSRHPFSVRQFAALLEQRIEPTVLLVDEQVAGFGCLYKLRAPRSVYIGNVMIDPDRRGQGLGRRMVLQLIDVAFRRYEVEQVRVSIFAHNTGALLACTRGGFRPYAVRERLDPNGNPVALLHLRIKRDTFVRPGPGS